MLNTNLLERITSNGFTIQLDGDSFIISPSSKLTNKQREYLISNKPQIMAQLLNPLKQKRRPIIRFKTIDGSGTFLGNFDDTPESLIAILQDKYGKRLEATSHE